MGGFRASAVLVVALLVTTRVSADAEHQRNGDSSKPFSREESDELEITVSDGELKGMDEQTNRKIQFPTAEIADAVLGTGIPSNQEAILSVVQNIKDERSAFELKDTQCTDGNGENVECSSPDEVFPSLTYIPFGSQKGELLTKRETGILEPVQVENRAVEEGNATETTRAPKVNCEERNTTGLENFVVQILNSSQDLMDFLNANGTDCSVVLFYTPWCRFSADLGPHFNALPRAFPSLQFLALDASQHSSLSTRFGTVAVPNILLFQGVKPMARFNHTDRTLSTLRAFIFNQTGIEANDAVEVIEQDLSGPLPSVAVRGIDWLLVFSVVFVCSFLIYGTVQSDSIKRLITGQEHEHQD
ncbi:thioredoxin domain-containing protein 15 isoform X1 [Rhincodon typus]|uniref:thioredoxin domain-containing protein 15 isoform X1 n=2 Tax=Rhincodon typus TaxID=259920 RepID=UPI0009A3F022|nr:thioredoxin domain-containing protein 15 isoform X1 [Rhincodon typus]